ncbi:MAG: hypothetical protein ABI425_03135 [Patescibacteria group bacterium]
MADVKEQEIIIHMTPTGEMVGPVGREDAHNKENPIPHAVVFTLLATKNKVDGQLEKGLFQVRGEQVKAYPGYLTLTASGHIQYEEGKPISQIALENAFRETAEETGLVENFPFELAAQGFLGIEKDQQYMFIFLAYVDELPTSLSTQEAEVKKMLTLKLGELMEFIQNGKVTPFALEALRLMGIIPSESS